MTASFPPEPARSSAVMLGASATIDRSAAERLEDGLIDRLRADDATATLVLHGDAAPLREEGGLRAVAASTVPDGAQWAFLGRRTDGTAVIAAVFAADAPEPLANTSWGRLRAVGGDLTVGEADLFTEALSLGRWLMDAPFCPACGTRTQIRAAGWSRTCPKCGREHFPRTDPAIIVAVTDHAGERLLLGSNALWSAERYSCFAGFAEAGESLETAVVREVREEAGVDLVDVRYRGSQAWPYPRSLMLGFHATAADAGAAHADGDEIAAVRWFSRDEIGEALAGRSDIVLPGAASISRRLIVDWHAASV